MAEPGGDFEKMSLHGLFIVFTTATAFLMDDITFTYQISSTNFENIAPSVLFHGNIARLKALAAEQIFLRYFNRNDPDSFYTTVQYLIEAVQTAHKALDLFKGKLHGHSVAF